jgi:hypothetical protein
VTAKKSGKKAVKKAVSGKAMVPGRNGGSIWNGPPANPVAGTGRPPDEVRAKLRELGAKKGIPFLEDLFDGKIMLSLLGKCDECGHDQPISAEWVELLTERVKVSVDQKLKAAEQTFKYGLQAKELVITSQDAAAFFDCVHTAIVEQFGATAGETIKTRALALMEGTK